MKRIALTFGFAIVATMAQAATVTPQAGAPDVIIVGMPDDLAAGHYADGCIDDGSCKAIHGAKIAQCATPECLEENRLQLDSAAVRQYLRDAGSALRHLRQ